MGYFPIPIYTLVHIPWAVSPAIESHSIHTSIIQKLPKRGQRSFNSRRMGKRRRSLAWGCPVVTARRNGACGLFESGREGFILDDPRDTDGLGETLMELRD